MPIYIVQKISVFQKYLKLWFTLLLMCPCPITALLFDNILIILFRIFIKFCMRKFWCHTLQHNTSRHAQDLVVWLWAKTIEKCWVRFMDIVFILLLYKKEQLFMIFFTFVVNLSLTSFLQFFISFYVFFYQLLMTCA